MESIQNYQPDTDTALGGNPTENTYNPKVDDPADIVLTFGKHKGKKLGDIPTDYVEWLFVKILG